MGNIKKREQLFDLYSENFRVVTQALKLNFPHPIYACPLCRRYFDKNTLDQTSNNPLTLEHIPPENSGGRDFVLTCKECNNNHGTHFDSHLKKMVETDKLFGFVENSELKTTLTLDGESKIGSMIKFISKNKMEMYMDEKRTAPKFHKNIINLFSKKKKSVELEFKIPMPNLQKAGISLLRSAYLLMFKEIGYEYLFWRNTHLISAWIQNYNFHKKTFKAIWNLGTDDVNLGINKISAPDLLKGCFIVVMKVKNNVDNPNYGVILPGKEDNELFDLTNFEQKEYKISFGPFSGQNLTNVNPLLKDYKAFKIGY